ncbi:hypothetical protein H6F32_12875 [Anabaena sp. FACHB-1237]|uniref:glucosamine inositolphosphorylceramide transferase family protein n=1 Tax=Anabaena sp. FACHB-1237 TaxID=2692769 RepID=UPI00168182E3|nr:hypothetical protein [Anabaena sp. FACHB-1237]MBD2138462.1 hypothetical protein [Anabaena sp. FACHB-1237]
MQLNPAKSRLDKLDREYLQTPKPKSLSSFKEIVKKFVRRKSDWSIGIYTGDSPFNLSSPENIKNPVLTAKDVTDVPADFVADPFMVCENGIWYMFFEVLNSLNNKGEIGLATSKDGFNWHYQQIVMREDFHLSYPYVFKFKNEYYMIPESFQSSSVRLYIATDFPTQWSFVTNLLDQSEFADSSIFQHNDMWWLLTTTSKDRNILRLFYSQQLIGLWIEHIKSPVIEENKKIARSAGRIVLLDGKIIRYTQDCERIYGSQVRAFEITDLTTTNYQEKEFQENPIIKASGSGWNKTGMHHIDPHKIDENKWIACVDGNNSRLVFVTKSNTDTLIKSAY